MEWVTRERPKIDRTVVEPPVQPDLFGQPHREGRGRQGAARRTGRRRLCVEGAQRGRVCDEPEKRRAPAPQTLSAQVATSVRRGSHEAE
jgi:hypothetical protein